MRVQFAHLPQKSGRPSALLGARQLRVWASIKARVYLPEPGVPERTTACGKRSRPSMSRRRWMVSALPWKSEKAIKHSIAAETEEIYCKSSTLCVDPSDWRHITACLLVSYRSSRLFRVSAGSHEMRAGNFNLRLTTCMIWLWV